MRVRGRAGPSSVLVCPFTTARNTWAKPSPRSRHRRSATTSSSSRTMRPPIAPRRSAGGPRSAIRESDTSATRRTSGVTATITDASSSPRATTFWESRTTTASHPEYLRTVLDVFGRDPAVVFCHARTFQLDQDGQVIGTFDAQPLLEVVVAARAVSRRHRASTRDRAPGGHPHETFSGECLPCSPTRRPTPTGRPSSPFTAGSSKSPTSSSIAGSAQDSGGAIPIYERIRWSDPSRSGNVIFPNWRRPAEYLRSVGRSPLSPVEKILCAREVWRLRPRAAGCTPSLRDVRVAARTVLARSSMGASILATRDRAKKP